MTRELFIRPEADRDFADAFNWYEEQRQGLGARFVVSVEAAFSDIRRNPLAYPEVHEGVRRALTKRFPYAVFYFVEPRRLVVFAIMHAKRDPRRWQRRVSGNPPDTPAADPS